MSTSATVTGKVFPHLIPVPKKYKIKPGMLCNANLITHNLFTIEHRKQIKYLKLDIVLFILNELINVNVSSNKS